MAKSSSRENKISDRKVCVVNIQLAIPRGISLGLISTEYRGFVQLDDKTIGVHETLYSFNKSYITSAFQSSKFTGPIVDEYYVKTDLDLSSVNWSPCGDTQPELTLRTSLMTQILDFRRGSRSIQAVIGIDSIDQSYTQSYKLISKKCESNDQGSDANLNLVHKLSNGSQTLYTLDLRKIETGYWSPQGIAFKTFKDQELNNLPLYSCSNPRAQSSNISTSQNCDRQSKLEFLGYISPFIKSNTSKLSEYISRDGSKKMYSLDRVAPAGYVLAKSIGFVPN